MLDYRAHKLLWLLSLPLRLIGRVSLFVILAISILIAQQTQYNFWLKVVIAFALTEGLGFAVWLVWALLNWILQTIFFWVVDVIPARGADEHEAREIVKYGRVIWLLKKFRTQIEDWTYEDTEAFVSLLSWRLRWLFDGKSRFEQRVRLLYEFWEETGRQPEALSPAELKTICASIEDRWFVVMIVHPAFFNSFVGFILVVVTLNTLR